MNRRKIRPARRIPLLVLALLAVSALSKQEANVNIGQPADERAAQNALPQSKDPMWKILGKTKIHLDKKEWHYSATYPDEVKALVGREVTVSGFVLPLEPSEKFHHFILSKRTPTCAFCPPGEPNEIIDVTLEKPMKWDEGVVKITGVFGLMSNPELGLFFTLAKARREP